MVSGAVPDFEPRPSNIQIWVLFSAKNNLSDYAGHLPGNRNRLQPVPYLLGLLNHKLFKTYLQIF